MNDFPIGIDGLTKHYGSTVAADNVSFSVPAGTVLGLLGPNGAGKTTVVSMLATLLKPTSGTARVNGFDICTQSAQVRRNIGLAGQYAAVDELLTGAENLEMVGRLYGLRAKPAKQRAQELLQRFDLVEAGSRIAKTYSGGMRRRLDLAASLVLSPPILFLDEPTTGLDPRSRLELWTIIEELASDGITVLLTTQYLEEADRLADRVIVIDTGAIIADGTPDELKSKIGGSVLEVRTGEGFSVEAARQALSTFASSSQIEVSGAASPIVRAALDVDAAQLAAAINALASAGASIEQINWLRPSLDDVFMQLTGNSTSDETAEPMVNA